MRAVDEKPFMDVESELYRPLLNLSPREVSVKRPSGHEAISQPERWSAITETDERAPPVPTKAMSHGRAGVAYPRVRAVQCDTRIYMRTSLAIELE